jgi:hypothetical protein
MSRTDPAAVVADLERLVSNLHHAFHAPAQASHTTRDRYVVALKEIADFFERFDDDIAYRFIVLAAALRDLHGRALTDLLRPGTIGGRGPDGRLVWNRRLEVVTGLELILRSRDMKIREAAEHIAKNYPVFNQLKRDPGDDLAWSIRSWRRGINEGKVPEFDALAHQRRLLEQFADRPLTDMFALGELVLTQAAERITQTA